jgi:hypothetical protein
MSTTSPEPVTEATKVAGNASSTDKYPDAMSADAEGFEAESPQARQARVEAMAHARAARAAKAKYARLVSQQASGPNGNAHNDMHAGSFNGMMTAQGDRIGGTEASLAVARIADQLRLVFLDEKRVHPGLKAGLTGVAAWLPLVWLRPPTRGSGVGGFVSDPRVLSFGGIALVTLADIFKDKIFDINRRLRSDDDQAQDTVAELLKHFDEGFAKLEKAMAATPPKKSS